MTGQKYTREQIFSELPTGKAMRILAVPAIMGTLVMAVYNIVDTAFIGMLRSTESLSAVSVAFPIMSLLNAVGQIIGVGAATYIGMQLGAQKKEQADRTASCALAVSMLCGVFFAVLGLLLMDPIFRAFGASEAVLPFAHRYGRWMFVNAILAIPNQALNNIARAETNARRSAIAMASGAIVNMLLDPIFMFDFGLGLGVAGASLATVVGQAVTFSVLISYFLKKKSLLHISVKNIRPNKEMILSVLKIGAPSGASQVLASAAVAVTNIIAAHYGDPVVAAVGIVLKVITFGQFILFGYVQGFQPIASYNYGARNMERFKSAFRNAMKVVVTVCLVLTGLYIVFRVPLLRIFTEDPAILDAAEPFLVSQVVLYTAMGVMFLITALLQSVGQGAKGILVSVSRQGLFFFPAILLFTRLYGLTGLYVTQPVCDALTLVLALFLFFRVRKTVLDKMERA